MFTCVYYVSQLYPILGGEALCRRHSVSSPPVTTAIWSKAGVPNLQDLMLDDLRWSWRNNNRNKVHNKCNVLELSRNPPPQPWSMGKLSSMKLAPSAKKVVDCWSRASPLWAEWFTLPWQGCLPRIHWYAVLAPGLVSQLSGPVLCGGWPLGVGLHPAVAGCSSRDWYQPSGCGAGDWLSAFW